ncbi:MAG: protein kinase [Proteobacteria bacterium]|nr:protein kinase [Pseudomonadota bacterium]
MSRSLTFGPFELLNVAGRGGMGVVWRAMHTGDDVEVAIKLLHAGSVEESALHREVEATASLNHPGIISVYDYGRLPADLPVTPDLPREAPFFVMEYLPGGSLGQISTALNWTGARSVLLHLLDALAHAHARHVAHLDLKPANVLRDGNGDWRLVDFGIANVAQEPGKVVGTPQYMAPEQLRGDMAAIGPRSDLFALGTLAWRLVTGTAPRGGTPSAIFSQALAGSLGPFETRFRTPPQLEPWLRRLMEPDPGDRFPTAADAAHALASMPTFTSRRAPMDDMPVQDASSTFTLDAVTAAFDAQPQASPGEGSHQAFERPPCPESWRQTDPTPRPPSSLGLGLFAVRPLPFVGRWAERDVLWSALLDVHRHPKARWVALHGGRGIGRTRLGEWVIQRAHELGSAAVWHLDFSEPDPLRSMLLTGLGPGVPSPEVLASRLDSSIDTAMVQGLSSWLHDSERPAPDARLALVLRSMAACAPDRPVLLWVDDVDQHDVASRLVEKAAQLDAAVLVVTASREDIPIAHTHVALDRIDNPSMRSLLRGSLGLCEALVHELTERAGGSPRYITQVLTALAERGELEPGPGGYTLAPRTSLTDASEVHQSRVAHWLTNAEDRHAIEVAALLGPYVEQDVWHRALEHAAISPSADLVDRGMRFGWLRVRPKGWAFADAALHSAVTPSVEHHGIWHRACAAALEGTDEYLRLAKHLIEAGDTPAAIPHLRRAAMKANRGGDLSLARRLFGMTGRAQLEVGNREAFAEMLGWEAWMDYQLGEFDKACVQAKEVMAIGSALDSDALLASGAYTLGVVAASRGTAAAKPLLMEAAALYLKSGDTVMAAQAESTAMLSAPVTEREIDRIEEIAEGSGHATVRTMVRRNLAQALIRAGRHKEALTTAMAVTEEFEALGLRQGAVAWLQVAHAQMSLGHFEAAIAAFQTGQRGYVDELGLQSVEIRLAIGLCKLLLRDWEEGARLVRLGARALAHGNSMESLICAEYGLLSSYAWEGDERSFDLGLIAVRGQLSSFGAHIESPLHLHPALAGEVWLERGDLERARIAFEEAGRIAELSGRADPELYRERARASDANEVP